MGLSGKDYKDVPDWELFGCSSPEEYEAKKQFDKHDDDYEDLSDLFEEEGSI